MVKADIVDGWTEYVVHLFFMTMWKYIFMGTSSKGQTSLWRRPPWTMLMAFVRAVLNGSILKNEWYKPIGTP